MRDGRLLLALLVSATAVTLIASVVFRPAFPNEFSGALLLFTAVWMGSAAIHLLFGSLAHVALRSLGKSNLLHYLAAGAFVGLLVFGGLDLLPDSEESTRTVVQALSAASVFGLFGAASAGIFWLLAVRRSDHAA